MKEFGLIEFILIIFGMVLWQLITFIVCAVTDNEEKTAIAGVGIFYLFAQGFVAIARKVYKTWVDKNYCIYRFCYRGKNDEVGKDLNWFYARKKYADKFNYDTSSKYFVEFVKNASDMKNIPYKNEIYKGQDKLLGWEVKKFLKEES